jgi:hypothetical protein
MSEANERSEDPSHGPKAKSNKIADEEKKCQWEKCSNPTQSHHFYKVGESTKGGGKCWAHLVGKVLCSGCYNQYRKRGTLERESTAAHKPKENEGSPAAVNDGTPRLLCSYAMCQKPLENHKFYRVSETYTAGRNVCWAPILGWTLCHACYRQYKRTGSFERPLGKKFEATEKRCTNVTCDNPTANSRFFVVDNTFKAGGRDWTSLQGHILCHACYSRFRQRGTLNKYSERGEGLVVRDDASAKAKKRKARLENGESVQDTETGNNKSASAARRAGTGGGVVSIGMVCSEMVRLDTRSQVTEVSAMVAANDTSAGLLSSIRGASRCE